MPNLHPVFLTFEQNLSVPKSKRDKLKKSRESVRQQIRDHFKEHHPHLTPQFYIQGSYKNKTMIRTKYDECDVDDGVYFFPKPDETATTLQKWVKDALQDHTNTPPKHKKHCVRVIYASDYNIDLPILYMITKDDDKPFVAVKNEDWKADDPKAFVDWFDGKKKEKGDQLRRIVKYLKAWSDHVRHKMLDGLPMTILAARHMAANEREDKALRSTLKAIRYELGKEWKCNMPTRPKEDLLADKDEDFKKRFFQHLDAFITDADEAISTEDAKKAHNLWKKHLGKWFPDYDEKKEEAKTVGEALKSGSMAFGLSGNGTERRPISRNKGYYGSK